MSEASKDGERQGDLTTPTKAWTPEEITALRAAAKQVPWGYLTWTHQLVRDLGHYPGGVRWKAPSKGAK